MTKWSVLFLLYQCVTLSYHEAVYSIYTFNTTYISNGSECSHFLRTVISSSQIPVVPRQSFSHNIRWLWCLQKNKPYQTTLDVQPTRYPLQLMRMQHKGPQPSIPPGSKASMVHSVSGCMQVKLWDPLRMCAIPEHFRGVITTRCYTNPHVPTFNKNHNSNSSSLHLITKHTQ